MALESRLMKHIDLLIERYPSLEPIKQDLIDAYLIIEESYEKGGKLLVSGNGGSAADSEHIVGELMKAFDKKRKVSDEWREKLASCKDSEYIIDCWTKRNPRTNRLCYCKICIDRGNAFTFNGGCFKKHHG